jgi:glycerophosphoryl diester phosphodiesterase
MLSDWPYPFWIAHRGAGKLAPENTLAAFRLGAQYGYRAFECDVKLSADGQPFLLHDATLDRTTPERGVAAERDWADLSRLDAGGWHSRAYAGEPLPSLAAVAQFARRNACALNIEIKPTPGAEADTGRVVTREASRLWDGDELPPLLSSFRPESLQAALAEAPALPRALLLDTLWAGWDTMSAQLDCVAVVCNYTVYDQALVDKLHAAGLRALAYTVNDPATAHWLIGLGLDGLITDAVDRFAPAQGSSTPRTRA